MDSTHSPLSSDLEISVVMPCLNEALTVQTCVEKAHRHLESHGIKHEILVADNGSTDGSQALAKRSGARVIHVSDRGYGNALRAGIDAARGRFVIMGDADDSYDFSDLTRFIERLRQGDDLVMGNRFKGGIKPGAMKWLHRYVGNPVLTGILNLFFRSPIHDAHCGLRGFRKASYLALNLRTNGMEFASEMVVKACLVGQRISEVPTVLSPDGRDRPPHLRTFRDGWRHLRFLLLMCPVWLYLLPAGILMAVGAALMMALSRGPVSAFGVTFDIHTMLFGAQMAIVGYQTLWLWGFSKIYGWRVGILPAKTFTARNFKILNLEVGLVVGGLMVFTGLGIFAYLVLVWQARRFGAMAVDSSLRVAVWSVTFMVVGFQTVFGSFFLSMLGIDTGAQPAAWREL